MKVECNVGNRMRHLNIYEMVFIFGIIMWFNGDRENDIWYMAYKSLCIVFLKVAKIND